MARELMLLKIMAALSILEYWICLVVVVLLGAVLVLNDGATSYSGHVEVGTGYMKRSMKGSQYIWSKRRTRLKEICSNNKGWIGCGVVLFEPTGQGGKSRTQTWLTGAYQKHEVLNLEPVARKLWKQTSVKGTWRRDGAGPVFIRERT